MESGNTLGIGSFGTCADSNVHSSTFRQDQFMNPGPAPRPPTDRPRLNLTPSANIPGNMSQLSLQSPSVRTLASASNTSIHSPLLSRTMSYEANGGLMVIKEGNIKYKEESFTGFIWKTKYAILRPNQLDFAKTYDSKVQTTIALKDVTNVQRHDLIPLCIQIVRAANAAAYAGVSVREQPQKNIFLQFKSDDELYEWQDSIYNRCPSISGVSAPTNFSHQVHVGFDPTNGNFVGLPHEWEKLLNASAITKDDYKKNPQAVIEVLEFYSDINKRAENPEEYPSLTPTPGPSSSSQNLQLGHGGGGTSIAPPRPPPPTVAQRQNSYQYQPGGYRSDSPARSQASTPVHPAMRKASGSDSRYDPYSSASSQDTGNGKMAMDGGMRAAMEEEARRVKQQQQDRERERERERERVLL